MDAGSDQYLANRHHLVGADAAQHGDKGAGGKGAGKQGML
jgi:hypothetical protein